MFSEKLNGEMNLNAEKKENGSCQKRKKVRSDFSFNLGGGVLTFLSHQ